MPDELGAVFSVAAAKDHGLRRGALSSPHLTAPFHGVREIPSEDAAESNNDIVRRLAAAYAPRMRDADFVSHTSAARQHSAPLPREADARLHIATVRPRRATQAKGVVPHSVDVRAASIVMVEGIAVASPATTWAMLGGSLEVPWLVAVGDYFCRVWRSVGYYRPNAGKKPLSTPHDLAETVETVRWHGSARLRAALPLIRLDSWSPMESLTRFHLVTNGLPEPVLNRDAYDRFGAHLGCLDMSYPEWKVAVEYQGQSHGRQYARDIERVERLRAEGWIVIQVTSELIRDPAALVRRVRDALVSRGWNGRAVPDESTSTARG